MAKIFFKNYLNFGKVLTPKIAKPIFLPEDEDLQMIQSTNPVENSSLLRQEELIILSSAKPGFTQSFCFSFKLKNLLDNDATFSRYKHREKVYLPFFCQ